MNLPTSFSSRECPQARVVLNYTAWGCFSSPRRADRLKTVLVRAKFTGLEDDVKDDEMVRTQPLHGSSSALTAEQIAENSARLDESWSLTKDGYLVREFPFRDFAGAHAFADGLARLAIQVEHYPEITVGWGRVELRTRTPRAAGLTELDFLLAFRADQLYTKQRPPKGE
jgi:4a-hydroxytetrahydrobiopterin dehydratase